MKAVVYDAYGSFNLLAVEDVPRPIIRDDEVLVRVYAALTPAGTLILNSGSGAQGFDMSSRR